MAPNTSNSSDKQDKIAKQAVVIGGSMAALLAARALATHFERVVVIERDPRPEVALPRKGTPQSHHAHVLLKSGENVLDQFFPGLMDQLQTQGNRIDFSADVCWFHHGEWKLRYDSGFSLSIQTRPILESLIRHYVEAIPNVSFRYGCAVTDLIASEDKSRINGITIQTARTGKLEAVSADLVIDATGRCTKTAQWLETLGYPAPESTQIKIDLTYSSRLYAAPPAASGDWKLMVINPNPPDTTRAGYIFPLKGGMWLVTVAGYSNDRTPEFNDKFLDYTRGLAQPDLYEAIKDLKPLSDVKIYNFPAEIRYHYEALQRFPDGLIVMGDAFCSFDPVFGQGMSVAAKEALCLDEMLTQESRRSDPGLAGFPRRFHKRIATEIATPWLLATSEDFRYPKTQGKKPFGLPILHWYTGHIFALSATDQQVYMAFGRVMHLLNGSAGLFQPAIALKVIGHALRGLVQRRRTHAADRRPDRPLNSQPFPVPGASMPARH